MITGHRAASGAPRGSTRHNGNGKAPCVLIVDDDPAIRMLFSINLGIDGLVVLEAEDGDRALEHVRSECPDLVVTDVTMPGMNGFELAAALRRDERTRRLPLIFLSAETEPANEVLARDLGALAYVTKPFDPPALWSLVTSVFAWGGNREQTTGAARPTA